VRLKAHDCLAGGEVDMFPTTYMTLLLSRPFLSGNTYLLSNEGPAQYLYHQNITSPSGVNRSSGFPFSTFISSPLSERRHSSDTSFFVFCSGAELATT
jgi:hypothetical protein